MSCYKQLTIEKNEIPESPLLPSLSNIHNLQTPKKLQNKGVSSEALLNFTCSTSFFLFIFFPSHDGKQVSFCPRMGFCGCVIQRERCMVQFQGEKGRSNRQVTEKWQDVNNNEIYRNIFGPHSRAQGMIPGESCVGSGVGLDDSDASLPTMQILKKNQPI